jgi:hypothetical protein
MNVTKERRGSASSELPEAAQEETLPLYQEFQLQDPDTDRDTIPPLTATPAEVRDYLASLLRKRHSLSDDQVRRVVARWTLASGRELRIYTAQMYLDIFGSECGWTLYRDVKLELYRTTPNSFAQDGRICEYSHARDAAAPSFIIFRTNNADNTIQTSTLQAHGCLHVSS